MHAHLLKLLKVLMSHTGLIIPHHKHVYRRVPGVHGVWVIRFRLRMSGADIKVARIQTRRTGTGPDRQPPFPLRTELVGT
jgi:hypothetical protein